MTLFNSRIARPNLDRLEDRCLPDATWPNRTIMHTPVLVVSAMLAIVAVGAEPPKSKPSAEKDRPEEVLNLDQYSTVPTQAVNGVTFDIEASQVLDKDSNRIVINWNLRYDGPRYPLTIVKPSLTLETMGQTELLILAVGKSGKVYGWTVRSPTSVANVLDETFRSPKSWFMTIPRKEERAGFHRLVTDDIRRYLIRTLPSEFDARTPPKLYFQMVHKPTDRGEHHSFDAWTGRLVSRLAQAQLKEW